MTSRYARAMEFGRPTPVHAQTDAARAAVDAHRRAANAGKLEREAAEIVRDVGRPHREPYTGTPGAAPGLIKRAERNGFDVKVIRDVEAYVVEGHHAERREGFRVIYRDGKTKLATWHEPFRYAMVDDERPVARQDQKAKTSTRTGRPIGVGRFHLSLVGCPSGMPVGVREVERRIGP